MTDKTQSKLAREERETYIYLDDMTGEAVMDSTIPKDYNKALRRGWKPTVRYLAPDGSVVGYTFRVPRNLISFRSQKEMTEKQLKRGVELLRARMTKN